MKIAFIADALKRGGAERTITYLADYFAREGHEVYIVLSSDQVMYAQNPAVKVVCLGVSLEPSANPAVRAVKKLKRLMLQRRALSRIRPDAVLVMGIINAELICGAKKKLGFRLFASERSNPSEASAEKRRKVKRVLPYADGLIFQTERAQAYYKQYFNTGIRSCIIANAVGNPLAYTVTAPEQKENKIVAIGRLQPVKGYPTLLRAFQLVRASHPSLKLEIYGDGPEEDRLKEFAKELGIEADVDFMGNREDALRSAASAACYVLSSVHEGMPNALMEAMAIGIPCVSTDCPNGPAELIRDGENGLLVKVDDVRGMADAICLLLDDPQLAQRCAAGGRALLKTHSIAVKAQEYLRFISAKW